METLLKAIAIALTIIGIWTGGYMVGLGYGERKVANILYRIKHLEQRIGNVNVLENGKTSGFVKAIIDED